MNMTGKKRSGMARPVIAGGFIILLFGVAILFIAPNVQATVSVSNPLTVDCSSGQYCVVQGLVTNFAATSNNQPSYYTVSFCTYGGLTTASAPAYSTCYEQFNQASGQTYYSETLYTGTIVVGASQTVQFQIPLKVTQNGQVVPILPVGTYWETMCVQDAYTSSGNNCGVSSTAITFNQGTTVSSTTVATTGPVPFSIDYGTQFTLVSVSPAGSGVSTCTPTNQGSGMCPQGLSAYIGYWNPGTQLSVIVTFPSAYYNAKACASTCQTITTNVPFTVTVLPPASNGVLSDVIVQAQASTTPPITITPESSGAGAWTPTTEQTINPSTSPTQTTFTLAPTAGDTCSGSWVLYSPGTNQYFLAGSGATGSGITFTYSQLQQYVATQGDTFQLFSGSQTSLGCNAITFTLTIQNSVPNGVASWTCTAFDPAVNSPNSYACPAVQTFANGQVQVQANPAAGYGYPVVYTVNGVQQAPVGGATSTTPAGVNAYYTASMSQNIVISASFTQGGQGPGQCLGPTCTPNQGPCQLNPSTNANIALTVVDSTTGKLLTGAYVSANTPAGPITGTTNSAGIVNICNFPVPTATINLNNAGNVDVTVSDTNYKTQTFSITVTQGQTTTYTAQISPNPSFASAYGTIAGGVVALVGLGTMAYGFVAGPKKRSTK